MANIINQIQVGETPHDIQASAIFYGEVDSTSTSTAYTATIPNLTTLIDGTTIMLRNGVVTSASGFTININGLGAKPVYNNMTTGNDVTPTAPTRDTTIFNINYTMLLTYVESDIVEGGCWICYRGYNSDNNTIGYQLRTNSTAMPTITRTRYYRLLFTSADHIHWVPANTTYDNSATSKKTVNPHAIDPFGHIVYMSGTTNVNAGSNVGATVCWSRYTLALGYSFNTTGKALTLTYPAPVYVQCTPAADGSATMEGYVQSLPNTNDGKIYIFLGVAYSATNIELYDIHPVYWYDGDGIKLWTGVDTSQFATLADIGSLGGGTITQVKTTAGAHTEITVTNGAANFNVPTKVSHLTNDSGYTTNIGTVTSVKINNTTKTPTSGVVDLGTVLTTYTETDPIFATSVAAGITASDITNWGYAYGGYSTLQWNSVSEALKMSKQGTMTTIFSRSDLNIPTAAATNTTGISIADHATTTITGVQSSTTSVTGVQASTTTASKITTTAISIPNVTAAGSGSASLTMTMDTTDTKQLNIAFSHVHTPPTLGTALTVTAVQSNSDVTVPIKATAATTVPIKNTSTTTVVTGKSHTITDNGHAHTI